MTARRAAWSRTKAIVPVLTLFLLVLTGCAGQQPGEEAPIAGSFVGEVPDANAFVAIVADLPEGEGDERAVRAYLCDGQTVSDWFWGSVDANNDLSLSSDGGAQLEGRLTSDGAAGTITDPGGNSVPFEAPLATGIAGLYDVNIASDGIFSGTSQIGGRLEGQLGDGNTLEEYGSYPVRGTITPAEGQPQDFRAFTSPNTSEDHRWIVLADGRIKGGNFGGGYDFDGLVFERRFGCDFYYFDYYDFDRCDFDFEDYYYYDEDFDDYYYDFDDRDDFFFFEHRDDFDERDLDGVGRDRVGGTFGQVGGGGQQQGGTQQGGGGGGGGGGKGGGGGGQGGGGGGKGE